MKTAKHYAKILIIMEIGNFEMVKQILFFCRCRRLGIKEQAAYINQLLVVFNVLIGDQ